jgi:hypothetical protein
MNIELSETDIDKIIKALEWTFAYTVAQKRDDSSYYKELAERLKRKEPQSETRIQEWAKKPG